MNWDTYIKNFRTFLKLEKSLSVNSIDAYSSDLQKLVSFLEMHELDLQPSQVEHRHLSDFLAWISHLGLNARSQARIISGIRAFYKFLLLEDLIETDPTTLLESPRIGRKLPVVLSVEEIDRIFSETDLSKPEGRRNKAMLEVLYGCGLRVSELCDLKLSNIYFEKGFIRIMGKGSKERLVPVGRINA